MTNIVPFQRRQERGSWEPQRPPPSGSTPHSRWWQRWNLWRARNLALAALIGGLAAQPANALASNVTSTSVHFDLCGQGARTNCFVDGDTIWYQGIKIRLATIDAPEIHDYKCSSELALGERSKVRLLELMNAGPFKVVRSGSRDEDRYGRKLRDIRRGGRSLSNILIGEGLAARWEGQKHAWC
jgi:micrococcal nuclease